MHRHRKSVLAASLALAATIALDTDLVSQLKPGHSLATVTITTTPRQSEIYDIDHEAGTATSLTVPAAIVEPNCILMDTTSVNPAGELTKGWVGTNASGDIYEITYTAGTLTAKKLNTTATAGANVAQMVQVGSNLYFTTQTAGVIGTLHSMPIFGGPATQVLDLSTVGGVQLANGVAAIGQVVYVGTFNSGSAANSTGELISYDTLTKTGQKVMDIPPGVWQTGWGFGVVNMHWIPVRPTRLALIGVYGDYFEIDVFTKKLEVQEFTGSGLGNGGNNSVNSAYWNPVGRDWVVGSRDGYVEYWVDGQSAEKVVPGVGTSTTLTQNSVTGIYYHPPAAGSDISIGKGCVGPGGFTATDVSFGAPVAGNTKFQLAMHSGDGGDPCMLRLGVLPLATPFDLGVIGAPGCKLYNLELIALVFGLTGTGNGLGTIALKAPIPGSIPKGTTVYRQWLLANKAPVNTLGVTVSNARRIDF